MRGRCLAACAKADVPLIARSAAVVCAAAGVTHAASAETKAAASTCNDIPTPFDCPALRSPIAAQRSTSAAILADRWPPRACTRPQTNDCLCTMVGPQLPILSGGVLLCNGGALIRGAFYETALAQWHCSIVHRGPCTLGGHTGQGTANRVLYLVRVLRRRQHRLRVRESQRNRRHLLHRQSWRCCRHDRCLEPVG